MVAAFPTMIVEVAFTTPPLSGSPSWTNITSFVEWDAGASVKRGRTYETEQIQPSTLTLTLNNADGRFTAGYAAGAYAPNVRPNRRIRVRATWNSITYPIFDGYVDTWPTAWDGGVWSKATITATDRRKLLARRSLRSMMEEETLELNPYAYFPLTESSEATGASDISGNNHRPAIPRPIGSGNGTVGFGSGPALVDELPTAVFTRTDADDGMVLYSRFTQQNLTAFTVSLWVSLPHQTQDLFQLNTVTTGETHAVLKYIAEEDDVLGLKPRTLRFFMHPAQVSPALESAPLPYLANGQFHHIAIGARIVGLGPAWVANVYVDGVNVSGEDILMDPPLFTDFGLVDELWIGGGSNSVSRATIGHVALFPSYIGLSNIQKIHQGPKYYPADLAGARIARLLGYVGMSLTSPDAGKLTFGRQVTTGQTVDAAADQVAANDGGVFFIGAEGSGRFHDRDHRSTAINITPNPSFEVDTADWSSTDGTITRVTTQQHSGIASAEFTITDLVGTPVFRTATASLITGIVGNAWYYLSCWDRLSTAGTRSAAIKPIFLRADNSITSNPTTVFTSSAQGQWVQRTYIAQAPSDAAKIQVTIAYDTADAVLSDVHQIDSVETNKAAFVLAADQLERDLQFEVDESLIRNMVTITRANGPEYVRTDASSVTEHGQLDYSEPVLLTNDRDASDRAAYVLLRYKQPSPRVSSLAVNLVTKTTAEQATLYPALLAADIGQRFVISGLPTGAPASLVALDVDGIEHSISPDEWTVKIDGSPPPPPFVPRAFFKLDDPVLGELDAGNFLGA